MVRVPAFCKILPLPQQRVTEYGVRWRSFFIENLASDNQTGIGIWQSEMFIDTISALIQLGPGRPIRFCAYGLISFVIGHCRTVFLSKVDLSN